jgi:hypothetical protein
MVSSDRLVVCAWELKEGVGRERILWPLSQPVDQHDSRTSLRDTQSTAIPDSRAIPLGQTTFQHQRGRALARPGLSYPNAHTTLSQIADAAMESSTCGMVLHATWRAAVDAERMRL